MAKVNSVETDAPCKRFKVKNITYKNKIQPVVQNDEYQLDPRV